MLKKDLLIARVVFIILEPKWKKQTNEHTKKQNQLQNSKNQIFFGGKAELFLSRVSDCRKMFLSYGCHREDVS